MLKRLLCAVAITFFFSTPAAAKDGNYVMQKCSINKAECRMYVEGVVTPLVGFASLHSCLPKGTTIDQVTDILLKYVILNPAKRHLLMPFIFDHALSEAFDCPHFYMTTFLLLKNGLQARSTPK